MTNLIRLYIIKEVTRDKVTFHNHWGTPSKSLFHESRCGQMWELTYEGDNDGAEIINVRRKS